MICPRCKSELNDDMSFCPQCGLKIERCPHCHQPILPNAKFCSHCGERLYEDVPQGVGGFYQPLGDEDNLKEETVDFEDIPVSHKVNKKVIGIGVAILIALTGISYLYLYHGPALNLARDNSSHQIKVKQQSIGGTTSYATFTGNINLSGLVYQSEDKFYICYDQGHLVSMDKDLKNRQTILNESVQYVNVTKDMIYYANKDNYLCQSSLDGKNKKILINKAVYYVIVKDDKIYYQLDEDHEALYVYDIKTKKETKLNERQSFSLNILDDKIYFTSSDGIYSIGLDGKGEEKLLSGKYYNLIYQDGYLYCGKTDGSLMSYDIKNKETQTYDKNVQMFINMSDHNLFYYTNDMNVMKYDLKTKKKTKIYSGYITGGQIIGDKLILMTGGSYSDNAYQVIMDFNGENQQRLFTDGQGDFI